MFIVTGGLGFIGSNLVEMLSKNGYDVVVCDVPRPDRFKNLNGVKFIDLITPDNLMKFTEYLNVEGIFHQGACSDTLEDSNKVIDKNFNFTRDLINNCITQGIPLVYASSAAVYGKDAILPVENQPLTPLNMYGFSKVLVDNYVLRCLHSPRNTNKIVGLRYFNVFGKNESHKKKMASFLYQKVKQKREENKIELFDQPGNDPFFRDFIHVDDVCKINLAAMERAKSGIYNVGTGAVTTFTEMAEIVSQGTIPLTYINFPENLNSRYQAYTWANLNNLRNFYKEEIMDPLQAAKNMLEKGEFTL